MINIGTKENLLKIANDLQENYPTVTTTNEHKSLFLTEITDRQLGTIIQRGGEVIRSHAYQEWSPIHLFIRCEHLNMPLHKLIKLLHDCETRCMNMGFGSTIGVLTRALLEASGLGVDDNGKVQEA